MFFQSYSSVILQLNLDLTLFIEEITPMACSHVCSLLFSLPSPYLCLLTLFTSHAILLLFCFHFSPVVFLCLSLSLPSLFDPPYFSPPRLLLWSCLLFSGCPPPVSALPLCYCRSFPRLPLTILSSIHPSIHPRLSFCRLASCQSSTPPLH